MDIRNAYGTSARASSSLIAAHRCYDVLFRRSLLEHHELIAAITRDKATRRRADLFERSRYDLESMVALHMSIAIVNLLKAVGVHHKQIHIIGLIQHLRRATAYRSQNGCDC